MRLLLAGFPTKPQQSTLRYLANYCATSPMFSAKNEVREVVCVAVILKYWRNSAWKEKNEMFERVVNNTQALLYIHRACRLLLEMVEILEEDEYFWDLRFQGVRGYRRSINGNHRGVLCDLSWPHRRSPQNLRGLPNLGFRKGTFTITELISALFKKNSDISQAKQMEFATHPRMQPNALLRSDCVIGVLQTVGLFPVAGIAGDIAKIWAKEKMGPVMDGFGDGWHVHNDVPYRVMPHISAALKPTPQYYSLVQQLKGAAHCLGAMSQVVRRREGRIPTVEGGGRDEYNGLLQEATLAYARKVEENKMGLQRVFGYSEAANHAKNQRSSIWHFDFNESLATEFRDLWVAEGMDAN
ncbi:hypothetical protein HDU76_009487 [Blyttiomyces sp. JEL0837]|nr:hypothetical protein HDU76_009487 [Blyttiomyces sp. JEL0837]